MSIIGDALKQARERAGLSVADVSAQTRIPSNLIRAIERDDFAACGGDFYARGHIRAIARTVGVDSLPLIGEYDTAHPDAGPATLDDLLGNAVPAPGTLAGTYQGPRRSSHGPNPWRMLPIIFGALAVISVGVYRVSAGTGGPFPQTAAASQPTASSAAVSPVSASASGPAPSPSHSPSASPSPSPSVSQTTVRPQSATAFGPGGTSGGDKPPSASGSRAPVRESRAASAGRSQCQLFRCRDPRRVPGPHRGSGRRADEIGNTTRRSG